jgi:hypothetical protein
LKSVTVGSRLAVSSRVPYLRHSGHYGRWWTIPNTGELNLISKSHDVIDEMAWAPPQIFGPMPKYFVRNRRASLTSFLSTTTYCAVNWIPSFDFSTLVLQLIEFLICRLKNSAVSVRGWTRLPLRPHHVHSELIVGVNLTGESRLSCARRVVQCWK